MEMRNEFRIRVVLTVGSKSMVHYYCIVGEIHGRMWRTIVKILYSIPCPNREVIDPQGGT